MTLIATIICGGAGSRLWPLSRESSPKPFIQLPGGGTLIGRTCERAANLDGVGQILTVTNRDLLFLTADAYALAPEADHVFLLEPVGRDTAAAVALASLHVAATHGSDALLLILPADHLIEDVPAFEAAVARAQELASQGRIVTFGIVPDRPETGFGYLEVEGENVLRFVEKPDAATAAAYVASGRHYWNSGMFCFPAGVMIEAMKTHCPRILEGAKAALDHARKGAVGDISTFEVAHEPFAAVPAISIDYAVMEKADNVACVTLSCGWSDVGSWAAISGLVEADLAGNRIIGEVVVDDSLDCFVHSEDRLVSLVGVSDLVVVDTPDALLIARKSQAQNVKTVFDRLKAQNHAAASLHRTVHRPWGTYTVLESGAGFKIKRIEVKPGGRLSLQSHNHRSEHWVVVRGTAKVINGYGVLLLEHNESTYVPVGQKHRLENPGTEVLAMIEVQCGEYLGEDDIERFDDIYGRS